MVYRSVLFSQVLSGPDPCWKQKTGVKNATPLLPKAHAHPDPSVCRRDVGDDYLGAALRLVRPVATRTMGPMEWCPCLCWWWVVLFIFSLLVEAIIQNGTIPWMVFIYSQESTQYPSVVSYDQSTRLLSLPKSFHLTKRL